MENSFRHEKGETEQSGRVVTGNSAPYHKIECKTEIDATEEILDLHLTKT